MANPSFAQLTVLAVAVFVGGCAKNDAPDGAQAGKSGGAAPATKGGGGRGGNQVQAVEVTPVLRRDLVESLTVVGSLAPNESAEMRPEGPGLVRGIFFEEGQQVKQGDLLVKIDDAELLAQYAQVEARFKLAELNVARSESLSESRTIPQSEADRARSEYASARAELSLLRLRLEKTEVRAPFDGVVGSRTISAGDYVTTNTILTTLNDLSQVKVTFQVPERFLATVGNGTDFILKSGSMDVSQPVSGKVYFVSAVIDRATRSSEVKGIVTDPPAFLRPGMFANVELVLDVRKGALTVPEGAILTTATGSQVILADDQGGEPVAKFVPVKLGLRSRGFVEITPLEGELKEQQQVVASGVGGLILYPGIKLQPKPLRSEFMPKDT
jgi:membrane fusion protein (multidrug efflux system)